MRIGILTGGGDCPGLNAVIRAVVLRAQTANDEVIGFHNGWQGLLEDDGVPLTPADVRDLLAVGGTVLGTSRTNPFNGDDGPERVAATCAANHLDAIIAVGGDDTLGAASRLSEVTPMIGVPKTIDNDLAATEMTFGFDTAVQIAVDAIDRLWTTAKSHDRAMVCEVMGRNAGHIATWAAIGGGATVTLVPEQPIDLDAVVTDLKARKSSGQRGAVVVVAEGAQFGSTGPTTVGSAVDEFGLARLGGIGETLANVLSERTAFETRATVLGHVQRGGTPTAFDRILATRFGVAAHTAVTNGEKGKMVALRAGEIVLVSLADAVAQPRLVDLALVEDVARGVS